MAEPHPYSALRKRKAGKSQGGGERGSKRREKGKKGKFTCMLLIFLPIFASKYFIYLPSEEELKRELNLKEFHKKE